MALDNMDELNAKNVSPFPTALRYGLIGGGITILLGLVAYLLGTHSAAGQAIGYLNFAIWIGAISLAIRAHRDNDLGGYISYGRCLGVGVLTSLVMAAMGVIWTVLLYKVIDPDFAQKTADMMVEKWEEAGMSDDQIEQMLPMATKFTGLVPMIMMSLIGTPIIGGIISLIAGAIMKKDRPMV